MELIDFAQDYGELAPGEQALFQESVRRVMAEGIIWREEAKDQRVYAFLQRHCDLVEAYLAVAAWELHFNELLGILSPASRWRSPQAAEPRHNCLAASLALTLCREQGKDGSDHDSQPGGRDVGDHSAVDLVFPGTGRAQKDQPAGSPAGVSEHETVPTASHDFF